MNLLRFLVMALLFSAVSTISAYAAPSHEILGYWHLSSNALNSVANTNHGVVAGEVVFQDSALVLNGDSFVSFGSDPSLCVTGGLSYCLWLKSEGDERLMRVLGKFRVSENSREYCAFLSPDNRVWAFFSSDGTVSEGRYLLLATETNAIPKGEWHHLAVTFEPGAGAHVYVDGRLKPTIDTGVSNLPCLYSGSSELTLGTYNLPANIPLHSGERPGEGSSAPAALTTNFFRGSVCQFLLIQGALWPGEVKQLYELGRYGTAENVLLNVFAQDTPAVYEPLRGTTQPGTNSALQAGTNSLLTSGVTNSPPESSIPPGYGKRTIYVDAKTGHDDNTGFSAVISGRDGPKRTIRSALQTAQNGDTVVIRQGSYGEDLNAAGRDVKVRIEGNVNLSGQK